jgi:hypothetical protein
MAQHHGSLAIAFELAEMGARMVETRFRREHPEATDAEVAERLRAWWHDRPGAPQGDCPGRVLTLDDRLDRPS